MFASEIRQVGWLEFPAFTGTRAMMMPFRIEDLDTVPFGQYRAALAKLRALAPVRAGVAYLTIDEALVRAGETHRRPGIHVDGVGPDGRPGGWGGGGGYASNGMLVAASVGACVGWSKTFAGAPGPNGDCSHLEAQCPDGEAIEFVSGGVFWCSPLAVHRSVPLERATPRQFIRLSMPSHAPWYDGYTRNPLGVQPTGPIHPRRAEFMAFRP